MISADRHPDWHVEYDIDPNQAAQTRHKFYDIAAAEKTMVIGFHFSFPSAGYVPTRRPFFFRAIRRAGR